MMRFSFFTVLLSLLASVVFAQENLPEYMENTLIVKFKNEQAATEYRAKSTPQASLFTNHNLNSGRSIWKQEFSNRIQENMRKKGKVAKITSMDRLKNVYEFNYSSDIDPLVLARKISRLPGVDYAEPRYLYKTTLNTSDPIRNDYVDFHNFHRAWDISTSSSDVIIGIVDSGVNYEHEDLSDKLWVNEDEIPNNGIDDDNNGFVDDYLGWDFWDRGFTNADIRSDNDPFSSNNPHGSHVAGIATATPDNDLGLAGSGFNARYMAVKVGGAPDDPSTSGDESRSIGFGYEGILYAVMNGADIVNNSWGGSGFSIFGRDVVNLATEAGVLVIAAAGNDGAEVTQYPADYESVLSVGALGTRGDEIADYTNFGYNVDVFATGTIRSTVGTSASETSSYSTFQGTSMASPVVAGLAALLKTEYPDWGPERMMLQIRSSSVSIEEANRENLKNRLGLGKIDAEQALLSPKPGVRVDSVEFLNSEGELLNVNEEGIIRLHVTNYGAPVTSLSLTISSISENIGIEDGTFQIGALSTNEKSTLDIPVSLDERILQTLNSRFFIEFEDIPSQYSDFRIITYDEIRSNTSQVNNLAISFTPTGNIGFYDAGNLAGGVGFVPFPETANFSEDNLLYEGGLMLEINQQIANTLRENPNSTPNRDFVPVSFLKFTEPGLISDADGTTTFKPKEISGIQGAEVTLNTYAFDSDGLSNSVILNYIIKNKSATLSYSDVYIGIFNDWDIGEVNNNSAYYNEANDVLYILEEGDSSHPIVALANLANTSSVLAIENGFEGSGNEFQFNIYDGFSKTEKSLSLRAGVNNTQVLNADVSAVVANGPYFIPPGDSISVGFVYTFGEDEQEVLDQVNAVKALSLFELSNINNDPDLGFPDETSLLQNFPNPFNPSTTFSFNLNRISNVTLSVYNILGQKVRTILDNERLQGGIHQYPVTLDNLSSGVYFAVMESIDRKETIRITLVK
ncbi:MAG: S8 family peptidase [Balneolaceae bacterium]|nr:S8 family peptidase [Balneolaceae bacterium]MBO6545258.1 S8 family peptidase [Balneolaceae bacterium]MBO6646654.1 S8 family peptidase [Balneolaceae bacterium]